MHVFFEGGHSGNLTTLRSKEMDALREISASKEDGAGPDLRKLADLDIATFSGRFTSYSCPVMFATTKLPNSFGICVRSKRLF